MAVVKYVQEATGQRGYVGTMYLSRAVYSRGVLERVCKVYITPTQKLVAVISHSTLLLAARLSSRVANRRNCWPRLMRHSSRWRRRERARANSPVRPSCRLRGRGSRSPCWRTWCRICPLRYPGSPTTRWGRRLGRSGPRRLTGTRPHERVEAHGLVLRCRCADEGHPLAPPSACRWTVVLQPPWLWPQAADSGARVWPQPRAEGLGSWGHRDHGGSSSAGHGRRLGLAPPSRAAPRCQPAASGRSDWRPCATDHCVRADPAPGRSIQSMPLRRRRCSTAGRPGVGFCGGSRGWSRSQYVLVTSPRFIR
jgi:hypothetical protein